MKTRSYIAMAALTVVTSLTSGFAHAQIRTTSLNCSGKVDKADITLKLKKHLDYNAGKIQVDAALAVKGCVKGYGAECGDITAQGTYPTKTRDEADPISVAVNLNAKNGSEIVQVLPLAKTYSRVPGYAVVLQLPTGNSALPYLILRGNLLATGDNVPMMAVISVGNGKQENPLGSAIINCTYDSGM